VGEFDDEADWIVTRASRPAMVTRLTATSARARKEMSLLKKIKQWLGELFTPTEFLYDSCMYSYPSACSRPEPPNAKRCPDYKRK